MSYFAFAPIFAAQCFVETLNQFEWAEIATRAYEYAKGRRGPLTHMNAWQAVVFYARVQVLRSNVGWAVVATKARRR